MNPTGQPERFVDWQPIGEGGTANVFRVEDRELGLPVAIKLLNETHRSNEKLLQGLRSEVLISRRLRHDYICPIHDIYEGERGFGIVMDLLSGTTLRDWMDENRGVLLATLPQRLMLLRKVAEALAVAHTHIVHRDLKPSNVFLRGGDMEQPLILDFGISMVGTPEQEGFGGGTLKYMAPEQVQPPFHVDSRTDLFAFGIMAYELLTAGRIPPSSLKDYLKTRTIPKVSVAEIERPSRFCPAIPAALDRMILQLLSFLPDDRPRDADEVAAILGQVELDQGEASELLSDAGRDVAAAAAGVTVPAADYHIGSGPDSENPEELPMRRVQLSAYSIGEAPVTVAEYRQFLDSTGYQEPPGFDAGGASDALPVTGVTWQDAMTYAAWAGGSLPSEAQWEVAAKAGDRLRSYPWGEEPPGPSQANIDFNVGAATPVRSYPAGRNEWGLWDICGNVWEWCRDDWDPELYRRFEHGSMDPVLETGSSAKSIRGGSFESFDSMGRCAFRQYAAADERRLDIGFRIVTPA
ncbi:MAG: bifunctional serine/threonine-protein kinase/formylglycine-generating enzyme family protein [Alphaproteobacteria bacterium]|nr:bifunctional serine/threonine-protein kinase/formylglycine-generating enzyme family protein [Alphaproteobacteria bacterium]